MENWNRKNSEEQQETEKMRMSDCFITAMFLPKEYDKLLNLKTGRRIAYLVLLMLLASVIQYAIPTMGAVAGMGGVRNIVLHEIPEFAFQDGKLSFDKRLEHTEESTKSYMLLDTDVEKFTKEDVPRNMSDAILISQTNILVYNSMGGLGGLVQEQTFDSYKPLTITNEAVARQAPLIYIILVLLFVVMYGATFVKYLLLALFFAAVMYVMTRSLMLELTFGKIYQVAVLAQSVGIIVVAITYCIGSPLFILAGNAFHMLVSVMIMNRVLVHKEMGSIL